MRTTNSNALSPLLIIGANGQLGRDLVAVCRYRKQAFVATQRTSTGDCVALDLSSEMDLYGLIQTQAPSCVLNTAAYTAVDTAEKEPEQAYQVNAVAPGLLAQACAEFSIPLVHFSTDYVFSGLQTRAYKEHDVCAPINVYGQSKAEGEQRIREHLNEHYIFRSSWLYRPGHRNFVTTMLRLFAGSDPVRVVDDQQGCPTWTRCLAESVIEFVQRGLLEPEYFAASSGTYHLCARGHSSWHGFAQAIASKAQPPPLTALQPIASSEYVTPASRPAFSVLDCTLAENRLGLRLPHWKEQINAAMSLFNSKSSQVPI